MINAHQVTTCLNSLSGSARRVYSCVPIQEAWGVPEIMKALTNAGQGGVPDRKVVSGCLNDLTDSGVIRRFGRDLYKRTAVRPVNAQQTKPQEETKPASNEIIEENIAVPNLAMIPTLTEATNKTAPVDTLSILASAAETLRANAKQILALATHIEDLGLQLEEERETVRKKMAEIDQLKSLLSSITSS